MTDKSSTPHATRTHNNAEPAASHSGLDVNGQFRIGDKISMGVRGADIVLTQSHSGREVIVSEPVLQGLLEDEYFTEKKT